MTGYGQDSAHQTKEQAMSTNDLEQQVQDLKTSQAVMQAELMGAQSTQAATEAGHAATNAATAAGTWSTMIAGAAGFLLGIFTALAFVAVARD
ncbi:MAG TPA: hypothetical protein VNT51_13310 [Miltoncostaeaceae bacterium]|jgi:hypothetical protein|nr:hypothetical protein [Miltoncostaeaceae bacterium]